MKNFIILSLCLLAPGLLLSQTIVKGGGVVYCNGAPSHTVSINTDSEVALDTASGLWYEWNRDAIAWGKAGFRIQHLPISVAPTGAPQDKQSEVVINDVDSLYQWRGGAWRHLNKIWDGSVTNEGILGVGAGGASSSVLLSNTSGAAGVTINVAGINAITETTSSNGGSITITATEVDGSITNELQTYSHAGTTTYTNTLSNGGGSWSITGAGIAVISQTAGAITVTATEVDGSVTNEGLLGVGAGGASSSVLLSNTSGAAGVTINVAGINAITETTSANGGSITITATEVDGSTTNELQTFASTSDATSHTLTLSNSGGSIKLVEGANITLTTSGTGLDGIVTIAATSGGGSDLTFSGTSSPVTLNSSSGTDVTFTAGGILSFSATGTNITMTATEVDGSVTNELQTYSHAGTTTYTNTLSNGGGSWSITGAGIAVISQTGGAVTVTATEVDGSITNELQTYSHAGTTTYTNTLSNGGGSWSITGAGIAVISQTAGAITVTATEVDGSVSNELQTYSHAGTTTYTNTLSNGGGSWSITGAGIAVISQTAGAVTVTATEVDGSTTNELQTFASTSDATSHTLTLSNSGGSIKLVEGSGITLTTSGTGLDGIVTIAATTQATDLTFSGTSSPVTLNSSSGTDVTFTAGGILSFSASGTNITMTATEVDGSITNELQTYSHAGTTTYTNTLSNGGGSWSITGAGIAVISQTAGAVTVTATEVDGSVTNEGLLGVGAGGASSSVLLSNTSGAAGVTINVAGINAITETTSANGGSITITATEVDGSTTNELQTYSHAGTTTYTNTLSNGGGSWSITGAGIAVISQTGGAVTVTATEVDGSITNELQTFASTSDATSHTVTLSNSGGSFKLVEGANITLTTSGTGLDGIVTIAATSGGGSDLTFSGTSSPVTLNSSSGTDVTFTAGGILSFSATGTNITMTATEVDGSTTNELQTYSHAGTTTYTNTLSNGGGSWSITGAGIAVISQTAGAVTVTATEVDGSVTNELQTYSHAGTTTYTNTLSNGGGSWSITGAGIAVISQTAGAITVTATEVDGSTTNELQTYSHAGTTTYTNTLSNGGGSWSITGAGIAVISQTAGAVTVTATEVDGSTTNELQTLASTSDATSHTLTLSNSGGSIKLVEGSGITLTTSGTGLDGIVTIAATTQATDLTFSGTSSPVTLNSSSGTDVIFTAGGILSFSASGTNITMTATEVDGSVTNELQTYSHAGTTTYTNTLSNGGGSWSITGAGIAVISQTAGAVTVTATEVDGSVTNEGLLGVGAGGASSSVLLSNTSGAVGVTINVAGINAITETTSANGGSITITATEVDGSTTNELQTYSHAGTTTYTNTLSNGGGSWSITGAGIAVISQTAGAVTVTATEVDGSTTNELQTLASTSDATSHTVTLSNSGGSFKLVEGSNITLTTSGTGLDGIVTIASTGGSVTEGQGIDVTSSVVNLGAPDSTTSLVTSKRYINIDDDAAFIQFSTSRELFDDGAAAAPVLRFINQQSGSATEGAGISFLEKNGATLLSQSTIFNAGSGLNFQTTKDLYSIASGKATIQADSIILLTVPTQSKIPAVVGITDGGTLKSIKGSANGDKLSWQSGGWVVAAGGSPGITGSGSASHGAYWTSATNLSFDADFQFDATNFGFGGAPNASFRTYTNGNTRADGSVLSRGTGTPVSGGTAAFKAQNTTASTGDTWYFGSMNDGTGVIQSGNASTVVKLQVDGTTETIYDLQVDFLNGTPTKVAGVDGSGLVGEVTLGSGVTLSSGELPLWNSNDAGSITSLTSTALADVTGLSFAVTSGKKYEFWACIKYSAAATTTGSAFSINGPAGTVQCFVESGLTSTTTFNHWQNAVNTLSASGSSVYTSGNIAYVRGIVEPSANGTYIIRGATEVGSSAITVQGVSNINWREIK